MHALGRWIQAQLDARGWTPADLVRQHADLSRQLVSRLINDPDNRDYLDQTPRRRTLRALAAAFGVPMDEVLVVAAEAIGAPVSGITVSPLSRATAEELTDEILIRLRSVRPKEVPGRDQEAPASMTQTDPNDNVKQIRPPVRPRVTRAARTVRPADGTPTSDDGTTHTD